MAHAKLSPSSAHRWLNCPPSVKASERIPNRGSAAAVEGSIAHELSDATLKRAGDDCSVFIGKSLPDYPDYVITQEMADYCQIYVDYVRNLGGDQFYEVRVDYSAFVPDGHGTSDAIVLVGQTLYVIDLKYGKGVQVFAEENEQAQLYAIGALADFDYLAINKVVCVIVQPRLDHIDEWITTPADLFKFGEYASQKADEAILGTGKRVAGDKQCKWCPAKPTCPALKTLTEDTILTLFEKMDTKPIASLGDSQLRRAIENKKLIISWLDAVENLVTERLNNNESFEGFKLVEGRSLRRWGNDVDAELLLVDMLGHDAYNKKMLSVSQAEKALGSGGKKVLESYVVKPSGKPTLVPDSDKRRAVNVSPNDFKIIILD